MIYMPAAFSIIKNFGIVTCFTVFFIIQANLLAAPNAAIVKRINGSSVYARVLAGKKWKNIKRGDLVVTGSEIKTGKASSVVLVWKKLEFRVGQNSIIAVRKLLNSGKNRLHVAKGAAWFHLKKNSGLDLSVSSPTTIAAVRGTKFSIIQHKHDNVTCVCEGKISSTSTSDGKTRILTKGDSEHAYNTGKTSKLDYRKLFKGLQVDKKFLKRKEATAMQYCMTCHKPVDELTSGQNDDEDDMDDY